MSTDPRDTDRLFNGLAAVMLLGIATQQIRPNSTVGDSDQPVIDAGE